MRNVFIKWMKRTAVLCLFIVLKTPVFAQDPKWELVTPKYNTADAFVAGFNALDEGAVADGETDNTNLFQRLLDRLGRRANPGVGNGGILYVPEGQYSFSGRLTVPKGVTIRGEWEKPQKGQPIKGTIFLVRSGRGYDVNTDVRNEARAFITLEPCAAVKDVNIWYPEQEPDDIAPYPPAILFGDNGFWGNDYCNVSNVTLVNAFAGVIFSRRNGGGAPNVFGLYGTPLSKGLEIDNIAEVGRIDNVDFSPDYWAGSGLPGAPTMDGPHKQWMYENGTGVVMRRNDWSYACKMKIEGYKKGYWLVRSPDGVSTSGTPNGHNYGLEITNCKYAVFVENVSGSGQMHTGYKISNCEFGIYLEKDPTSSLQITNCEISATNAAIQSSTSSSTKLLIDQCTFNKGPVNVWGGLVSITDCDFNDSEGPQLILGSDVSAIVTGNRFKEPVSITNASKYPCIIDHTPIETKRIPDFPYKNQFDMTQKPTGTGYYLATAHGVSDEADDNSDALQAIFDKIGSEGGGVVFLPPGKYNFRQPLSLPSGVSLQGSVDVPCVPMGPGSIMEVYAGKDDENGTPFLTMEPGSGVRGLVFDYPEQTSDLLPSYANGFTDRLHKYPYTIRGNKDVYIVNIGLRASYYGIDLFTNKCDNHFIDYLAGHVFMIGVKVGNGSTGGHIYNTQFNQIAYACGGETKFGTWPNSPDNGSPDKDKYDAEKTAGYAYCFNNLDFMPLGDCSDLILFNDFIFGSHLGIHLIAENGTGPSGLAMGHALDAAIKTFNFDAIGPGGFDFVNTQIVTTTGWSNGSDGGMGSPNQKPETRYIVSAPTLNGEITMWGLNFWGQAYELANEIHGGTVTLHAAHYQDPGQRVFASIAEGAQFNLICSHINPASTLLSAGSAPRFFIQSSIVNSNNIDTETCGLWLNNMSNQKGGMSCDAGAFLPKDGWEASASFDSDNAYKALNCGSDTWWSTSTEHQIPGQWFMVNMQQACTFNGIVMEAEVTYRPTNYRILVSLDGEEWTLVAAGSSATASQIFFSHQTAQYIKVEQTGSNSRSSWRIAEFSVMSTPEPPNKTLIPDVRVEDVNVWFANDVLLLEGTVGQSRISIYNVSGRLVVQPVIVDNSLQIPLEPGIYIVVVENNGSVFKKKIRN